MTPCIQDQVQLALCNSFPIAVANMADRRWTQLSVISPMTQQKLLIALDGGDIPILLPAECHFPRFAFA